MTMLLRLIVISLLSTVLFTSCDLLEGDKKEPEKVETRPNFDSSYSVLWALNTKTTVNTGLTGVPGMDTGDMQVDFGTAFASFSDGTKSVPAGEVKVNDVTLIMQSNNFYMSPLPGITDITGITFEGTTKWSVAGANSIPAVNYTTKKRIPTATGFTCDVNVDKTTSYTITLSTVAYADSILYALNDVVKTVAGNVKSVTFTSEEMSSLKKGSAYAQVAPYNYEIKLYGSKNFVFGSQIVFSKMVTVK